ncbi:calmodulin-interacting protein 111-like [Amaranthus tricolor]|uniref:calmodulin-interacting protein 111-like n=1 Tax=Amaranthus tricolor TaxID=29722 RepID=UPI002582AC3D|nr:calmodulin-interacting protein 111-like [Amaranthus tricolor]
MRGRVWLMVSIGSLMDNFRLRAMTFVGRLPSKTNRKSEDCTKELTLLLFLQQTVLTRLILPCIDQIVLIYPTFMLCSSDVNITELAHLSEGCTDADTSLTCREAAISAIEENLNALEIKMEHLKNANSS